MHENVSHSLVSTIEVQVHISIAKNSICDFEITRLNLNLKVAHSKSFLDQFHFPYESQLITCLIFILSEPIM